ncbi:MAG: diaminopimelate decarboxylase [Alphaproteobacteria bacterium]|nr:diaminopimelate decarboxylase [Alphaproteobacteria bacterium]
MVFAYRDGVLHAEGVSLPFLAQKYGTPAYIYSAGTIRSQHAALKDALARFLPADRQPLLCYACKANSNIAILSLLRGLGCGLEIVSEGELFRGLKAGFSPETIITTSFGKTKEEIRAYLKAGIHQINIESAPELETVNDIAAELNVTAPVVFRLNPDIAGGGHHKISTGRKGDKFGLAAEEILELYARADAMPHVSPLGLAVHIGSQVSTVEAFKPAFEKLAAMVHSLRAEGHTVERLDIGGGFPVVYKDEKLLDLDSYAAWVRDIILPLDTEIQMEPGRYLVAGSGILLTRTAYIKETQGRSFLVLDAGMNDLIRPTLYEAYHGIRPVENPERTPRTYDVVGPICESGDIFARERTFPEVRDGELVAIETSGAYGFSMASNYNSRPLPPEILVEGDQAHLIRTRQTNEDMIAGESIPSALASQ